ncbi:MAG: hypothetical protein M0Q91_00085 [Methanoregula sp.]|nr:hypothetical protein [Methanoregula sp.]
MEKLRCPYCKAKLKYLLLPFHSSGAMNAATPNGAPQRYIGDHSKNLPARCISEKH